MIKDQGMTIWKADRGHDSGQCRGGFYALPFRAGINSASCLMIKKAHSESTAFTKNFAFAHFEIKARKPG
jgi:hypothetical protein